MRALLCVLALLASPAFAQVQEAVIGDSRIRLTPPAGHCVLSESQASDARALHAVRTAIPPTNRLLAMTAHCRQLADWRAGKRPRLEDIAQYQTRHQVQDVGPDPAGTVREVCNVLRAQGGELTGQVPGETNKRLQDAAISVKVNETRFLGVIAEEPLACYAAIAAKFRAETGDEVSTVTVFATTVIQGHFLFYYLTGPLNPARPFEDLLVRHRANMAAFRKANAQ